MLYAPFTAIFHGCFTCTLQCRHNGRDGFSHRQPHDYLLNRLYRRRSKKTSKLRVTGLCVGNPVNSPHKWPVTRKMFPYEDVIMRWGNLTTEDTTKQQSATHAQCLVSLLCITAYTSIHWNENVVLKKFAPLTALKVVKMATVSAAIYENLIKSNKISVFGVKRMLFIYEKDRLLLCELARALFIMDKMAAISLTIFLNAFSWMKSLVFLFEFHRSLFLKIQLTISQHWFRKWLGAEQATSLYLNQCWPDSHICGTRGRWINVTICITNFNNANTKVSVFFIRLYFNHPHYIFWIGRNKLHTSVTLVPHVYKHNELGTCARLSPGAALNET